MAQFSFTDPNGMIFSGSGNATPDGINGYYFVTNNGLNPFDVTRSLTGQAASQTISPGESRLFQNLQLQTVTIGPSAVPGNGLLKGIIDFGQNNNRVFKGTWSVDTQMWTQGAIVAGDIYNGGLSALGAPNGCYIFSNTSAVDARVFKVDDVGTKTTYDVLAGKCFVVPVYRFEALLVITLGATASSGIVEFIPDYCPLMPM